MTQEALQARKRTRAHVSGRQDQEALKRIEQSFLNKLEPLFPIHRALCRPLARGSHYKPLIKTNRSKCF